MYYSNKELDSRLGHKVDITEGASAQFLTWIFGHMSISGQYWKKSLGRLWAFFEDGFSTFSWAKKTTPLTWIRVRVKRQVLFYLYLLSYLVTVLKAWSSASIMKKLWDTLVCGIISYIYIRLNSICWYVIVRNCTVFIQSYRF